ncbi:lipoyl synthase, partial [Arthrobacter bambusae]
MRKKGREIPTHLAHIAEGIQDSGTTRQEARTLLAHHA